MPRNSEGIRVTDLERTVVDSINDFEKIGGFEELINCLSAIHYLDEDRLKAYLDAYGTQVLYQKTGFLLEHFMQVQLSQAFIDLVVHKRYPNQQCLALDTPTPCDLGGKA